MQEIQHTDQAISMAGDALKDDIRTLRQPCNYLIGLNTGNLSLMQANIIFDN